MPAGIGGWDFKIRFGLIDLALKELKVAVGRDILPWGTQTNFLSVIRPSLLRLSLVLTAAGGQHVMTST